VETSNETKYEVGVGLFTVIALIILIWGWSWLKGFSLHPPQRFIVKFHDVNGLNLNAPVNVNGVRVGTVEKIQLHGKGQVLCSLKITSEDITIPQGSQITIQTLGLVGAKYVEVTLPAVDPNEPPPPPIAPDTVLIGIDPVRVELYVNKIASNVGSVTDALSTNKAQASLTQAAENVGPAVENFKQATSKLNENMSKLSDTTASLEETAKKFGNGASSAQSFFSEGTETMKNVSALTKDFRATDHKVDKLLDNPAFGADLKDAFQTAKQTAEKIQSAIHELNATVNDKAVRDDMIVMLNKLADSTERIRDSMTLAKGMSDDTQLRSDVRDIVVTARDAMRKADDILGNPNFINDARLTMSKLQKASDSVDRASTNINRIIGSRHPIIHLFLNSNKPEKQKIEITTSGPGEKPVVEVTHP
jgi:ABC-type transporter Mla subunit MlaD